MLSGADNDPQLFEAFRILCTKVYCSCVCVCVCVCVRACVRACVWFKCLSLFLFYLSPISFSLYSPFFLPFTPVSLPILFLSPSLSSHSSSISLSSLLPSFSPPPSFSLPSLFLPSLPLSPLLPLSPSLGFSH